MNIVLVIFGVLFLAGLIWYRKAFLDMLNLIPYWSKMWQVKLHLQWKKHPYGSHKRQYVLSCPPNPEVSEKEEIILYFHGGGWQFSSPEGFLPAAQVMSNWGHHVIMASHRRLPLYSFKHMRQDISLVLEKTWEIMQEEGISHKNVIIGGMSSGGHLAATLYFDKKTLKALSFPEEKLSRIFLQAAPLDLEKMLWSPTLFNLVGSRTGKSFCAGSPITYLVERDERPIYLIHGNKDGIVQYECSLSFINKLKSLKFPNLRFETIDGGGHMSVSTWAAEDNEIRKKLKEWLNDPF